MSTQELDDDDMEMLTSKGKEDDCCKGVWACNGCTNSRPAKDVVSQKPLIPDAEINPDMCKAYWVGWAFFLACIISGNLIRAIFGFQLQQPGSNQYDSVVNGVGGAQWYVFLPDLVGWSVLLIIGLFTRLSGERTAAFLAYFFACCGILGAIFGMLGNGQYSVLTFSWVKSTEVGMYLLQGADNGLYIVMAVIIASRRNAAGQKGS